ncbi:hypothetical protein BSKO_11524 [Bryopsis sp. KO-2023]|nr:hypothetical protein BSKO_11524 [Bryopsis sp. KO-2023]
MNRVTPSHIRVDADEVTYPLHIIIRYEMEQGLIDGSISVNDVPAIWNAKMKEYLGIEPKNDSEGCLQDIHWAMGFFGYFPSYLLGAMYAAQFFEAAIQANPTLCDDFRKGEFDRFREWLKTAVHKPGFFANCSEDLLKEVCGKGLDPDVYVSYLKGKYEDLYCL